jgi:hypothetical protein
VSTKRSVAWDKDFHFYTDCFDDESVYLEIEGVEFEARPDRVVVTIPKSIWLVISASRVLESEWLDKTDAEIESYAVAAVDERIKKYGGSDGLGALCGSGVYGSANDPRERQIGRGIAYLKQEREKQQHWRDEANAIRDRMSKRNGRAE